MRSLLLALSVVVIACTPPNTSVPTPTRPFPDAAVSPLPAACATALSPLGPITATLTLLPNEIGHQYVFGLDGSLLATAYGYPIGAFRHWWEVDANGERVREFDWPGLLSSVVQSPEGQWVVYDEIDAATGGRAAFVRDLSGGTRFLREDALGITGWPDPDHALFELRNAPGIIHRVDLRSLVDEIVFRPPPPPSPPAADERDWFELTSDARWAIFTRAHADGEPLRMDLFDVTRQTYVVASLPLRSWLAARGDLLMWFEGDELRAMHLCDRRSATLATIPGAGIQPPGLFRLTARSADARFLAFAFGNTDAERGPERAVIVDLQRGVYADIAQPWGYVSRLSPDCRYAVLSRAGFHATTNRLAHLAMP